MRIPRKPFPKGAVRECSAYDYCGEAFRWDFAWRDPASGRVTQFNVIALAAPELSEADFAERVRKPALACIEREIHRKCGMDYAIKNQYHLSLPRGATARMV